MHGNKIIATDEAQTFFERSKRLKWYTNLLGNSPGQWSMEEFLRFNSIIISNPLGAQDRNDFVSSGFTYFGQFVTHDITHLKHYANINNPRLNLQSIYGGGPKISSNLYNENGQDIDSIASAKVNIHQLMYFNIEKMHEGFFDLQRTKDGIPHIADTRNDQNFLVSQIVVILMRFHNALLKRHSESLKKDELFEKTRSSVVRHFQWIVLHQYLKQIVYDSKLIDELIQDDCKFQLYNPLEQPILMPEFYNAVLRAGHSQVLPRYKINSDDPAVTLFSKDDLEDGQPLDLRGFAIRKKMNFEWNRFFFLDAEEDLVTRAGSFDPSIAPVLGKIPFLHDETIHSLILRDFLASKNVNFLHQEIAERLYARLGLNDSAIDLKGIRDVVEERLFDAMNSINTSSWNTENIPLWLYILLESKINYSGNRLGPLGSHILAEQIIWILKHDEDSCLRADNGTWEPDALFLPFNIPESIKYPLQYKRDLWSDQSSKFSMQHIFKFLQKNTQS